MKLPRALPGCNVSLRLAGTLPDLQGLADVPVEQVDVGGEGECGGGVAEAALGLDGGAALGEQQRGAGVPEGVEADPLQARLLACWLQHTAEDVLCRQWRAVN